MQLWSNGSNMLEVESSIHVPGLWLNKCQKNH
jgi:hypothetical protein